ncbi:MAG TPA: DinB family protein [Acidisarcina sp.]
MPIEDRALRDQLLELLRGGSAHANPSAALDDFPVELRGKRPDGVAHSGWQQLEHMRFTLHDLLNFCTDSNYLEPKWPDDYWTDSEEPPEPDSWDKTVAAFKADMKAFEDLVNDPAGNIYAEIPWGQGQTLFREILLVADHNSYHIGQIIMLRRSLGAWKGAN